MDWIEAALAFAVVMMLLSTAVTVIMEAAHNVLRIREKGLRRMVASLYDNVVVPRLPAIAGDASSGKFVDVVTGARYLPVPEDLGAADRSRLERIVSWLKSVVYRTVNAPQLKELSTLEFVERLAETPAGRKLFEESQRRGDDYLKTFLGDLASKFDDFSLSATEYFARRAKLTSSIIAMILVFSLNVNAVQIFDTLLRDDSLRASLISQGEDVATQLQAAERRLAELSESDRPADVDVDQEALERSVEELKSVVESLEKTGLPIGWDNVPWKKSGDEADGTRADDKPGEEAESADAEGPGFWKSMRIYGAWVLSVALAGLLIGLGGPFWFNVFRKLGSLVGMVRGMQTTLQKAKEKTGGTLEEEVRIITDVFQQAAKGNALADPAGRALLTPDGRVDDGGSR